jgi:hypothetical protein
MSSSSKGKPSNSIMQAAGQNSIKLTSSFASSMEESKKEP